MRRHPNRLLLRLFQASLIVLAAMHPEATARLAQLAAGVVLAVIQGVTAAAADNPGPAALAIGIACLAQQVRTHRPARART